MWFPFISLTDLLNVTVSQLEPPTPPVPSTPANFPSSPLLSPTLLLPLPEGDQLTATSWGGPEASCPCPRALLASGLDRMDRDRLNHSHSALHAHRHVSVTNIYNQGGGFSLRRDLEI